LVDGLGGDVGGLCEAFVGDRAPLCEQTVERDRDRLLLGVERGEGVAKLAGELRELGIAQVGDAHLVPPCG